MRTVRCYSAIEAGVKGYVEVPADLVEELKVFLGSLRSKETAREAEHYWRELVELDPPIAR
jgi:hypothetical protein